LQQEGQHPHLVRVTLAGLVRVRYMVALAVVALAQLVARVVAQHLI